MKYVLGLCAMWMGTHAVAAPVHSLRRGSGLDSEVQKVLFETQDYYVMRSAEATQEDFRDLYWVNLEDSLYDSLSLQSLGKVELFVPNAFAVMKLSSEQVVQAAEILHDDRWSCGQVIRLFGDEVAPRRAKIPVNPVIAVDQTIAGLEDLQAKVDPDKILETVESLVALGTRNARTEKANRVTDQMLSVFQGLAKGRSDVSYEKVQHSGYPQASYIVRIQGQTRPEELVIFGSHIDSINRSGTSQSAPGADDNASGTASQLELFRVIMSQGLRFDRTIEIHGYAAEELGLIGSQDIAKRYASAGKQVVAMVQNDMNLYKAGGPDTIWLVTNDTDPGLTKDAETLIKTYQDVAFNKNRLTAGTSDHRSWNRQGYAVIFPTENPTQYNRKIHTSDDVVASSGSFTQAAEFVKLSLSFAAHFAGLQD